MHTGPCCTGEKTLHGKIQLVSGSCIHSVQGTLQVLWEHTPAAKNRQ